MIRTTRRAALGLAVLPAAAYLVLVVGPASAATCNGKSQSSWITTTEGDDTIYGTIDDDVIIAGGGSDIIEPGSGNDTICGGAGDDQIHGGAGDDWIDAEAGDDVVKGDDGADDLRGNDGHDGVNGGFGNDTITGNAGDDLIVGHSGNDTISGGYGADALYGGYDDDALYGHVAGDNGDSGAADYIAGGPGNNTFGFVWPDERHLDNAGFVDCPRAPFRAVGTYAPARLLPDATECVTISGKPTIFNGGMHQDGDFTFNMAYDNKVFHVEFMPRDKYRLPLLTENTTVAITGMQALDTNPGHNNKLEIHPVFKVVVAGSSTYYSGPQYAGSPKEIRPTKSHTRLGGRRYCWSELGAPCQAWDTSTGTFD